MRKVIVQVKGGLGNQLFCYAAARRLAINQHADLVVDNISGFARDFVYQRIYALDGFNIAARTATYRERMEPLGRFRRRLARSIAKHYAFERRTFLAHDGLAFEHRLLEFCVHETVYLDGYWQSEKYFKDIENQIRQDFEMAPPRDQENRDMAARITHSNSVCVHIRRFSNTNDRHIGGNHEDLPSHYYQRAIETIKQRISEPVFFIFSDDPRSARQVVGLAEPAVYVDINRHDASGRTDLWLMRTGRHFIIANSTFSWWGAWLGSAEDKIVIAPDKAWTSSPTWGFEGLLPQEWTVIKPND